MTTFPLTSDNYVENPVARLRNQQYVTAHSEAPAQRLPNGSAGKSGSTNALRSSPSSAVGIHDNSSELGALYMAMEEGSISGFPFRIAAQIWLREHKRYISARTLHDYQQYIAAVNQFLGDVTVKDIQIAHIRMYQDIRKHADPNAKAIAQRYNIRQACETRINMETWIIQAVLKEAGLWGPQFVKLYHPLPIPRDKKDGAGRALTPEEEDRLLIVALSRKKWEVAGRCLLLMLRTGTGFGELRMVRRGDL